MDFGANPVVKYYYWGHTIGVRIMIVARVRLRDRVRVEDTATARITGFRSG